MKDGAFIIGVSEGAIQLGLKGYSTKEAHKYEPFQTFALVPYTFRAEKTRNIVQ